MWVLLLLLVTAWTARAEEPELPTLTISFAKDTYALGEPIEAVMRYTLAGPGQVSMPHITYDRSGRIGSFGFLGKDAQGQAVRLPWVFHGGPGGGAFGMATVSRERPFEQKVWLNEWLAFDRPGDYQVIGYSWLVGAKPSGGRFEPPMISAPVTLHLVAPEPSQRAARLAALAKALHEAGDQQRGQVYRELGYLLDPAAVGLLVRGLTDDGENCSFRACAGLRSLANREPAKAAILAHIKAARPAPSPDALSRYAWVLTELDADITGRAAPLGQTSPWLQRLRDMVAQQQPRVPDEQVARYVVEGIRSQMLRGDDIALWRRALRHADHLPRTLAETAGRQVARYCAASSLQHDLARVAEDQWLPGELRGGAMMALHRLGDDRQRDRIVIDVMRPHPEFGPLALRALGNYRGTEVGGALLTMATSETGNYETHAAAAERLRLLSPLLPAERLVNALRHHPNVPGYDDLLEALAMTDPRAAQPLVRERLAPGGPPWHTSFAMMRLAVALDMRDLVGTIFTCGDAERLNTLTYGMGQAWEAVDEPGEDQPWQSPRRGLACPRERIERWVPELLDVASQPVSANSAHRLLQGITNSARWQYAHQGEPVDAVWRAWWAKNHARLGR